MASIDVFKKATLLSPLLVLLHAAKRLQNTLIPKMHICFVSKKLTKNHLKMAFASRIKTSFALCLRGLTGVSHNSTRSFQIMIKPIPSASITTPLVTSTAATLALPAVPVASLQKLLTPFKTLLTQVAGFKVKGRIKRRCKDCYIVIRQQRQYVICPTHPRHKQMAMKQRDYKSWILTHATQSKERGY